ncbi:hypothetical protein A6A04_03085 [Paramagnetospirillum marisnigri]|uniref:PilZ domain-containing protein n=1 Tax=Paramagnetospirillum marisnigri TaxID=1285242 RepID=A0A178MKJ3_9PROT|nr:PilZ domain-containing protein [Paramagnetospirillum marisnigri]OAN49119.1 hypothetical protein A6A04_03085 [Paramagnetospirillum marisnigri]
MPVDSAEHRAYPRLSWAHPAQLFLGEMTQPAQVADLSLGGCKLLPSDLAPLKSLDLRTGTPLRIEMEGYTFQAIMRWATPNMSALGCAFDHVLTEADLEHLGIRLKTPSPA